MLIGNNLCSTEAANFSFTHAVECSVGTDTVQSVLLLETVVFSVSNLVSWSCRIIFLRDKVVV